jgi:uncharacterized protein (TIGR02117 family)
MIHPWRVLHLVFVILEFIALPVALWLAAAFSLSSVQLNSEFKPAKSEGVEIYISSNGVHTDFVLPVQNDVINWNRQLPLSAFDNADTTWTHLAFGWGNKEFYVNTPTWNDLTFTTAFKAAFGIGPASLHITRYRHAPAVSVNCIRYAISKDQYTRLVNYLQSHLLADGNQPQLVPHPGYGYNDRFYESQGHYSLLTTCNEWTGNGMEAAGLPVGLWTPLEFMIMKPQR